MKEKYAILIGMLLFFIGYLIFYRYELLGKIVLFFSALLSVYALLKFGGEFEKHDNN